MNTSQSQWAFRIEPATERDVPAIFRMIKALAEYERLTHKVVSTESSIRDALFGSRPAAEAAIAHAGDEPAGFALFFPTYSTFAGRPGMYLEDLFVELKWRRHGLGRKLLAYVAGVAAARGCNRLTWAVLDWNEPAIRFYKGLGAEATPEWQGYGLFGNTFTQLAETHTQGGK